MGVPYFKIAGLIQHHKIHILSSNYALYGDMSNRVMRALAKFTPKLEIYSIDEAFLDLSGFPQQDLATYGLNIANTVRQWTGIPVSIGIAPTKTLAKLANKISKKGLAGKQPVLVWDALTAPDSLLATLPIKDIWGISSGWDKRLNNLGIGNNVLALKQANPIWLRKHFGVVMERIFLELNGIPCIPLAAIAAQRQQILTSRSFGYRLTEISDLLAAVSAFTSRAAEKLRQQELSAQAICVFIHTSPFDPTTPAYNNAATLSFERPTQDTCLLVRCALSGLRKIFKPGYRYQRAGVLLFDLVPNGMRQLSLLTEYPDETSKSDNLMALLDEVNGHYGRHSLRFASAMLSCKWQMRQNLKSPAYTTNWRELPVVPVQ
jgi:DNA polymerase V